mmetsp:Transcript_1779/g.5168  ORF Transcript_1779/g.5168 Transcript_1779/m.5168 type:complete len:295 (+) Transcript_1779:234-1118(+)
MRVHDVSGETHDWRFEYSPAAPAHAHPLFEVAALRLGSSGGSSNGDVKGRPTLRKELKEQSRVGGLIRKASDAQRLLKEAVVEAQWAELGNHYGTQLLNFSRPRGHGVCDHNEFERWANILTSVPYAAVGFHTFRTQRSAEGRLYGASLAAVGAGSGIYHSSRGKYRSLGRKIDYWAIALASAALVRASRPGTPRLATATSIVLTPFQPFAVVSINAAVVEADFLRRAIRRPELRRAHRLHMGASLLGGAAFVGEEFFPKAPLIHTAWHLMSAVGLAATGCFLDDIDHHGNAFL